MAKHQGVTVDALVADAALGLLDENDAFRRAVREGLAQADAGQFIEEDEMDKRVKAMLAR